MSHGTTMFTQIPIDMPSHDADVVLTFPSGRQVTIQARPSNADEGFNGSLDFILPEDKIVTCWKGDDMEAAPPLHAAGGRENERIAKQLVTELP